MKFIIFSVCGLLMLSQMTFAGSEKHKAPTIPKEFADMKKLIGTWEGETDIQGKKMPMMVTYELTSGGTAITETLMKGTSQEMVSVYHKDGDGVAMTHYCALGNQPHMKLTKSTDTQVSFEMKKRVGIQSEKEPHMHSVTLTLKDDSTLEQKGAYYNEGKQSSTVTFEL